MNEPDLGSLLGEWAARTPSIEALILIGSRERAASDSVWRADPNSDWDFQIIAKEPKLFLTADWLKSIPGLTVRVYAPRSTRIGTVPSLNILQNILLPMDFAATLNKRQRLERARYLLNLVGLDDQAQQLPGQVSGGQQQRAAIARALANDPALIVADEPTGNLDGTTADAVFELFANLQRQGKTLIMVTHNESLAQAASRRSALFAGRIHEDQYLNRAG